MSTQAASPERNDVTAQLIGRMKELMIRGVLRPGCKIPPERELARMFGVSRSSLRQALKFLDLIGVLVQKVGHGSYLTTRASTILDEPLDFLICLEGIDLDELVEARLIVEPELAARAAERATSEDLRAIEQTLDLMSAHESEPLVVVEQDLAFHRAIHQAARNRICESIFVFVHRFIGASISLANQLVDVRHTLRFHKRIFKAIHDRNPDGARQAMAEHLLDVGKLLVRARGEANAEVIQHEIRAAGERARRERNGVGEGFPESAASAKSAEIMRGVGGGVKADHWGGAKGDHLRHC